MWLPSTHSSGRFEVGKSKARAELGADLVRFAPWAIGALFIGLASARTMRGSLSDEVAA